MPTYDYRCDGCGHEFELFQSMKDKPKRKCPKCSKNTLVRLIGTGAAVLFKGSGFYETDYRSPSYKKGAEAEKKSKEDAKASKKDDKKAPASSNGKGAGESKSSKSTSPKKD